MKQWNGYKKGINLGGWLSQCVHTTEHYDSFIKEKDIETIADLGFDHIRVPVDYDLVEDLTGSYRENGFVYIQKAIDWAGQYGLNMILDLHKTFGFSFDLDEQEVGFFENEAYQERFYRLWEQFATRFGSYGDRLAFELLNEVTDQSYSAKWNEISYKCIERIRAILPEVKILVGGYWNNSITSVKDLAVPYDENIIYNFHCYDPLIFTHQGASWVRDIPNDFRMKFKTTYGEFKKITDELITNLGDRFISAGDPNEVIGEKYFENLFEEALKVAGERDVPLYCGEYGVIDKADPADALDWLTAINKTFLKYDIGRALWSYKKMDFGLMDKRLDAYREDMLKVL